MGERAAEVGIRPRVLVVDDDEPIRHLVSVVLRGIADVTEAATAAEGLASLDGDAPALIILDARLPDAAGEDVARSIRQRPATAKTPIVLVTGDPPVDAPPGIDGYLRKPFDIEDLRACVRGYLGA